MSIFGKQEPQKSLPSNEITKGTLNAIWDNVDKDPLAGLGDISKRDLLIDRILAHIRSGAVSATLNSAAPLMSEVGEAA